MSPKRIITVVSIILGCALILLVVVGGLVYKSIISPLLAMREVPPELREPRVITGAGLLVKSEFYRAGKGSSWRDLLDPNKLKSRLDSIQDMAVGQLDGQGDLDVGLAGQYGLTLLDRQGNVTKRINYQFGKEKSRHGFETEREKDRFYNMRLLDVEGDGVCEVLGSGGLDGIALFDHQGNVLFSRGEYEEGKPSIHEVAAGDVDGDGVTEFIVSWGFESWKGLELFDRYGNSKWRRQEEFVPGEMGVVDVNGDGKAELVEEDGRNLKIRDTQGQVKTVVEAPVYLSHISLCSQPDNQGPPRNLSVSEGGLWLIDLDGKNYKRYDAPLSHIKLEKPRVVGVPGLPDLMTFDTADVYQAKCVLAELEKDRPKYLAVVANFGAIDRSLFYLYDAQGRLIYQEILPEQCDAIAVLPQENSSGRDEVLVSGEKTIWRYSTR
jgi:hypothetical protein